MDNCERYEGVDATNSIAQTRIDLDLYLLEAGLDPDQFQEHHNMMIEGLMMYQVVDKRRMELLDIRKGMICT